MSTDAILIIGVILAALCVSILMFIPSGDNITIYTNVLVGEHYISDDGYHVHILLGTSSVCGSFADRIAILRTKDVVVSEKVFNDTMIDPSVAITYTCKKGQIENIVWGI